jgi:hypothetical protein
MRQMFVGDEDIAEQNQTENSDGHTT